MNYLKQSISATTLLLSIACGRPDANGLSPTSHTGTDANVTYAFVGTDPQDSNIKVVVHVTNNSAQAGGNVVADANSVHDANTLAAPAPVASPAANDTNTTVSDANTAVSDANTTAANNANTTAVVDANTVTSGKYLIASGNRLVWNDGTAWQGRGANIQDARGCGACVQTDLGESTQEVLRRIDALTDDWHANFLRLTLESDTTPDILQSPNYLASVATIVAHVMQKPNVVLEVSLWIDPSLNSMGWPTAQTSATWKKLVSTIGQYPRVLFGIANEPQYNSDGSLDANVWSAMNQVAQSIRDQETASGFMQHIVVAQGTGGWARYLQYYQTHPLTAGNGNNFAYEVHVYDAASTFQQRFVTPASTLPVIIGEFGPADGAMTLQDCTTLMNTADALGVPYMGWTAHMRCPPSLLEDNSEGSCGIGMPLDPTAWGQLLIDRLASNVQ